MDKETKIDGACKSDNTEGGEETKSKKRFYTETWFVVVAIISSAIIILGILIGVAMGVQGLTFRELFGMEAKRLDFLSDSLNKYITVENKDYKNYDIEINLTKPNDMHLENKILQLLADNKGELLYDGKYQTKKVISPGDRIDFYYAAYVLDENGRRIEIDALTNYGDEAPESIEIGGGLFVDGFELGLVGKTPNPGFKAFHYGDVMEGDVVYATVSYISENGIVHYDEHLRIDLRDENVENIYGEGILDLLQQKQVGLINDEITVLTCPDTGEPIVYTEIVVDYITRCENENVITVETVFPTMYVKDNVSTNIIYFDVFVEQMLCYANDEFDETFVREKLKFTDEMLSEFKDESIVDKCKSYYRAELMKEYEANYKSAAEEKMWEILKENIQLKKYPEKEVDRIYADYVYSYQVSYAEQNEDLGYADFDEFMVAQLELETGANWSIHLLESVKDEVKEKLIFYTIIRREGLVPKGEEYNEIYRRELELDFEYYYGKDKNDYKTEAEYEKALSDFESMIIDYYGEEFYIDSVYYNYATDKLLDFATIINIAEKDN